MCRSTYHRNLKMVVPVQKLALWIARNYLMPGYYGGTNSQGSDQGTWYVQGDRIYYNSQSKGPGSYRLEKRNHPKNVNDPMIILDGTAYVTAYQKAPWR